jgi:hypothetical protein
MHTNILAASTRLWNQEFINRHMQAHRSLTKTCGVQKTRAQTKCDALRSNGRAPFLLRPRAPVMRFSRVANTLADVWCQPKVFYMLLFQLAVDDRGGRRGFPLEVRQDLAKLRIYFERTHSKKCVAK